MISFTEELHSWQEIPLAGNESAAGKIEIVPEFPDPEGLLETALRFLLSHCFCSGFQCT